MRWLWFLGSLACFAVLFRTTSIALALVCLVGALAFMLIGTLAVAAQRIERSRNDEARVYGPEEIRQMREAEARRQAAQQAGTQAEPEAAIVGVASASAMIADEMARRGTESTPPASAPDEPDAPDRPAP
jgi:hypothetical protein